LAGTKYEAPRNLFLGNGVEANGSILDHLLVEILRMREPSEEIYNKATPRIARQVIPGASVFMDPYQRKMGEVAERKGENMAPTVCEKRVVGLCEKHFGAVVHSIHPRCQVTDLATPFFARGS
jgi:hypothetical protein